MTNETEDTIDSNNDDTLSIDPHEPLINDLAHNLFVLTIKQVRKEQRQTKNRQQQQQPPKKPIERSTKLTKKKKLKIADVDRVFEEKCLRPETVKRDLYDLYQKSSGRIRSMLDIHQIDQFIQAKQNREHKK